MTVKQLGDFFLDKRIGIGGMGEVYKARQLSLDRTVAVKLLPRSLAAQESFIERFQREAKAAANLIHPNVIQIYSIGVEQGIPYFAMEYVEGEDLQQRMRRLGRLSFEESVEIIWGVTNALACAFEKGIVHRDIKPSNVMLDKNNVVKVMDFGLAKATQDNTNLTQAGLIMGTPNYISPEQARGDEMIDSRSDMYSLGIVFYELATGALPFRADTPAALIYKHAFEEPEPPTKVSGDVPPFIEEIILKMIAKEVGDRYPNPKALLTDLNEFRRNPEYYLRGGKRRGPAVPDAAVHHDRTMIDGKGVPSSTASIAEFQQAKTVGENTTNPTMVDARPRKGSSAGTAVAVVLVLAIGGAAAAWFLGPESLRQQILATVGQPGAGGPGGNGSSGSNGSGSGSGSGGMGSGQSGGQATGGGTQSGSQSGQQSPRMAFFPGAALRALVPDQVDAFLIREGLPHRLTFADFDVPPGKLIMRFDKRGYREILVSVDVVPGQESAAKILYEVEASLGRGFQLSDAMQVQFDQGQQALRDKQLDLAVRLFAGVTQSAPDFEPARAALEDAKREQQEVRAVFDRGQSLLELKRWDDAIAQLRKVPRSSLDYGSASGFISQAETTLRRLEDRRAMFRRHLEEGDLGAAEAAVRAIAEDLPTGAPEPETLRASVLRADTLVKRARSEFNAEQYEDAIRLLEELATLSPRHTELLAGGMLPRARDVLKTRAQSEERVRSGLDTARGHLDAGRFAEAIEAARRVLEVEPGTASAKQILAKAQSGLAEIDIRASVADLDGFFRARKIVEILERTDAGPARVTLERQLRELFSAPITVLASEHTDLEIKFSDLQDGVPTSAQIECWWNVTLGFATLAEARSYRPGQALAPPGSVRTAQARQIRQRVTLRKAERWLFTGFEQIGEGTGQ